MTKFTRVEWDGKCVCVRMVVDGGVVYPQKTSISERLSLIVSAEVRARTLPHSFPTN